jgi:hypothetical protein
MASWGIKALYPNTTANRPHVLGFLTARTVAADTLFEVFNGSSNSARRLTLDLNGALKLWGTASSLKLVDGITAPSAEVGYTSIYVDVADGDLKAIFGDGFVQVIGADS